VQFTAGLNAILAALGGGNYSGSRSFVSVMRGLRPAHPRLACREQDVDDRDKPGHDDLCFHLTERSYSAMRLAQIVVH
jgi:hypothetical protein